MLTSRERAYLRGLASKTECIMQIGKGGSSPEVVKSLDESLEKRELVKATLLNNCFEDIKDIASVLSERTRSEVVQIIGKKIIFYRKSKENNVVDLKGIK